MPTFASRRGGTPRLEAKRQVEEQRVKREREEAADREREEAAAELKGKKYEARRRAGDEPAAATPATGRRKFVKAKRLGGGTSTGAGTPGAGGGASLFGGATPSEEKPPAPSPFAGFSLLASPAPAQPAAAKQGSEGKPSVLSRLSGKPVSAQGVDETSTDVGGGGKEAASSAFLTKAAPAPPVSLAASRTKPETVKTALAIELGL